MLSPDIHRSLKVYVSQGRGADTRTVVGLVESVTEELTQNWTSPFEQDMGGLNLLRFVTNLGQAETNRTTITAFNSRQIWNGGTPTSVPVEMFFFAYDDPISQVERPAQWMKEFQAPELQRGVGSAASSALSGGVVDALGFVPFKVSLSVGSMIYTQLLIQNVSVNLNPKIRSRDGRAMMGVISFNCQTYQTQSAREISAHYL